MNDPNKFSKITTKCTDLAVWGEVAVDIIDLLLESCNEEIIEFLNRSIIILLVFTFVQHLICLVQHKHFDVSGSQVSPFDHI